jgi:hypothetical protein
MAKASSRARRRRASAEVPGVRHPWALYFPRIDPDVGDQMKRYGRSSAGTEEKVEARMKEAQRPWTTLTKTLGERRKEERAGFIFLRGARREAAFWLARLRRMAGARTDAELGVRNYFYGCAMMWENTANSGLAFLIGEWVLYAVKLYATRAPLVPALDFDEWAPGPPDLDPKLFGILERALFESSARNQGQVMESVPKSREGVQANYLLAGLVRTRIDPERGERRKKALSALVGKDTAAARRSQLLRELPGAARLAWDDRRDAFSLPDLVNRAAALIEGAASDEVFFAGERKADPTLDHTLRSPKRNRRSSNERPPLVEDSPEANPEALFETQEAVRLQLEELIKEHGLTSREAEVARLRFEGKETTEIATSLGLAESTVRVLEKRIRDRAQRDKAS